MFSRYILPHEIIFKIIRYLDIDTRRSVGIYIKLKIPDSLKDKITKSIKKINRSKKRRISKTLNSVSQLLLYMRKNDNLQNKKTNETEIPLTE